MLHKDPALAMQLYPNLEDRVTEGDYVLKEKIIKEWGNKLVN
jgi:hypothetical protein